MSLLFEGENLKGRAINVEIGKDNQGRKRARWEMKVAEGEHEGRIARYSGKLDPDNFKYTKRDMMTIGWKGESFKTFVDDVKAAGLVVEFTAEIASHNGSEWVSARLSGAVPLAALDSDDERDLDRMLATAGDSNEEGRGPIPF